MVASALLLLLISHSPSGLGPNGRAASSPVTIESLLPEMTGLDHLTKPPSPAYTEAQASSYDRRSVKPGTPDWFANDDWGKFVRTETIDGRKEYVMADLKGPGSVVRLWSPNPCGVVRFYFDGETTPRLQALMSDLYTGKVAPFSDPFAYASSRGTNLYFPFPYAQSLKITVDESTAEKPDHLYYHVGYRTYAAGTAVETFTPAGLDRAKDAMAAQAAALVAVPETSKVGTTVMAGPNKVQSTTIIGPTEIDSFAIKVDGIDGAPPTPPTSVTASEWRNPEAVHNILRKIIFTATVDGEECIRAPLGDFFGAAPGLNPYKSLPMEVDADGWLICRFPMPVRTLAKFSFDNMGQDGHLIHVAVHKKPLDPAATYKFHAQWLGEYAFTRPMRDMTFLDVQGQGYFVGSMLTVGNPVQDWWGEGDEKVWVDGDTFPSTFGTGTEDYYGFGWSNTELFQRPYHAQTRCDGPGNYGYTTVNRWQVFDPIPYTKNLKFTLEMWHWKECAASYTHMAYWYAAPGGTAPAPLDLFLLDPLFLPRP